MKLRISILFLLVALFSHLYLTNHYYELAFGLSADGSLCNINKQFSCDTVSASRYASLLGIPMAAWGAATSILLLIMVFGWLIRWTDDVARLSRYTFYLASFSAFMSLVMGSISMFILGTYCLFCIATYVCSFVVFELLRRSLPEDPRQFMDHVKALVGPAKIYLGMLAAIPVGAFLLNSGILSNYGAKNLKEFTDTAIFDWKNSPEVQWTAEPSLVKGASDGEARFVITEFVDFRCGHCKSASAPLTAFVGSRPDVQLRFYNFPLDSTCNESVNFGDGVSCLLAKAITCAEDLGQKGWDLHDRFFANQETLLGLGLTNAEDRTVAWAEELGLSGDDMKACVGRDETKAKISAQARAGSQAGVRGTPTIFVNGRKLPRGQSLHVLEKAYEITSRSHR